jgi:hypothetical protein
MRNARLRDAGREGGAAASGQDRRQADDAAQGPGGLYRRQAGRPVQERSLPVLSVSSGIAGLDSAIRRTKKGG